MAVTITAERPDSPDAVALITEFEAFLQPLYHFEIRHGYSVEKLIAQGVAFFITRHDGVAAGCGGVQFYGKEYAELKRMFVRPQFRRQGLAKLMLAHLADYAKSRGVGLLRLETGIYQGEAIGLYEQLGFRSIGPFGHYKEDPLSRFYEKRI
jgi:GNAT superfamily N-acetyltransferase